MALLKSNKKSGTSKFNWNLDDQKLKAEAGTYPGIIVDILEVEEVERTYKDVTKVVNITRFLLAYCNDDDEVVLATTFEFTISGNENSNLIKFCANLRGKMPPTDGTYDQLSELHKKCMVTIAERTSKEGVEYGYVKSLAPINKKLAGSCPDPSDVKIPGGLKFKPTEDKDDELPPVKEKKAEKKAEKTNDQEDPF